jgi:hypothetical protein
VEQFFTSLSKRQTMFLLTSLSFNSSEAVSAYEHLATDEEELLKHRALALLEVPKERRIPVLVGEIKRLVTQRRRQLGSADPSRLAAVLRHERPMMTEVVLRALPMDLAEAVRIELGSPLPMPLVHEVKPEVLSIIRWKLEDALRQGAPQIGGFRFTDLLTIQQRELLAVADRMGARVLATAVAGLAEAERADFLGKLPPDQRALAVRAAEAGASRRLSERDAKLVLDMHGAIEAPSAGMRSAGVQRIARACLAQSPEFAQRMVERHQGDLGRLLQRWVREERPKAVKGDGGRLDIVEQIERLAQKGVIDRPMRLPPPARPPVPVVPPPPPAPPPHPPAAVAPPQPLAPLPRAKPRASVATEFARGAERRGAPSREPGPRRESLEVPRVTERGPGTASCPPEAPLDRTVHRAAPAERSPAPLALQDRPTDASVNAAERPVASRSFQPLPARRNTGSPALPAAPPAPPPQVVPPRSPTTSLPVRRQPFPEYPGGPPRQPDSARVLRDGKPLDWKMADPTDTLPPGSQVGAVQEIPRRRERLGSGRSSVVKGRGPTGGSR